MSAAIRACTELRTPLGQAAALFRRIRDDDGIPTIGVFTEGTGNPDRVLIPHLHCLRRREREAKAR